MNPAGQRLLGCPPGQFEQQSPAPSGDCCSNSQALPAHYLDMLHPADRDRVTHAIERALADGRRWGGIVSGLTGAGQRFPAYLSLSCVVDAQGEVLGMVGVLRDLTEQMAIQQRLVQREKLASLGEMAAAVAHEIRNPLGGIKMATDVLSSGTAGGSTISREMTDSILAGVAEIESTVTDLLDYAREMRLDRQDYALGQILGPVVERYVPEARQRGVELETRGLDTEVVVSVDGQRLRQVFANVIRNALEATERREGARVDVALYTRDGRAVVEVTDNGDGIQPADRERIFLPFFTTKPAGTGLGLAIVKKVLDLHEGVIEVDTVPGSGTSFRVVLPGAATP